MNDTTSQETAQAFDDSTDKAQEFMLPAVKAARDAGIPEEFDDNTAVFLHRTALTGGYVLLAFDPVVLLAWAATGNGLKLLKGNVNFLPMGMPVISVELENLDATKNGEQQTGDQQ